MNSNTIMLIVAGLIVLAGVYWFFFTGTGNQVPLTAGASQGQAQVQFQTLAGELTPITFDTSIFSDPRFQSLADLATPITPESTGRIDPFAPVPGVVGR